MPEIKGITADKQIRRLYAIKPKDMARIAKPVIKEQVLKSSEKISRLVKDKAIDEYTHSVYIEEKDLQYPSKVQGNKKPAPISSNKLFTFLDKGTTPHPIPVKNAKSLHFLMGGKDVFRQKVSHPGTKAQNTWDMGPVIEAVNKMVAGKVKQVFTNQNVNV